MKGMGPKPRLCRDPAVGRLGVAVPLGVSLQALGLARDQGVIRGLGNLGRGRGTTAGSLAAEGDATIVGGGASDPGLAGAKEDHPDTTVREAHPALKKPLRHAVT